MQNELPKRKPTRLQCFDYNSAGAYFITICTQNKSKILSRVTGGDAFETPRVELLPCGKIADKYINQLNDFYDVIKVDRYVIMPNDIHMMLFVYDNGASRTSPPTKQHAAVSRFVSTFKRFCNKEYGRNVWQRHFNDHIIRNRRDYDEHKKYISENPLRWKFDQMYTEEP